MSESIEVFTFEDADGNEAGSFSTQSATEAKEHARRNGYRVRANTFEWADSELVDAWDWTERPEP